MNDNERAAFICGMVRAFEKVHWPKHFNRDDKAQWKQRAAWAAQMLTGGAYNPIHVFKVRELFEDELSS